MCIVSDIEPIPAGGVVKTPGLLQAKEADMMSIEDPISLNDYRLGSQIVAGVSRIDAQRQFRMSLVLVVLLSGASLIATVVTLSGLS
jgi:hypothetical protein